MSITSRATFHHNNYKKKHSTTASLTSSAAGYTGELLPVIGATQLAVRYESTVTSLSVQVVTEEGPNLYQARWYCQNLCRL